MRNRGLTGLPSLVALALVLMAAGPSVGDRVAAAQAAPPVEPARCEDNSAVLVSTGAADGVLFRCVGGVPVPRARPWSVDGCDWDSLPGSVLLAASPRTAWQPDTACLLTRSVDPTLGALPVAPGSGW
jgi:hypothetical protein